VLRDKSLDLNDVKVEAGALTLAVNDAIEAGNPPPVKTRGWLGPSSLGECSRQSQYRWFLVESLPVAKRSIFERGHWAEANTRELMRRAGFMFDWIKAHTEFTALGGMFSGHSDGVILKGPALPDVTYPCVWEHKCLNAKSFGEIKRKGIAATPSYLAQVLMYQHFLELLNPAIFTVTCANTLERIHLPVPHDLTLAREWIQKAKDIIEATRRDVLLPRVSADPKHWRCNMCSFRDRCWS
jgi:hypothetical protein